jgi:Ca2+-transporting ATPase
MSTQKEQKLSSTPWSLSTEHVVKELDTDAVNGLSSADASSRLAQYGPNAIPEPPDDPLWKRYWEQLTGDAVVRLLLVGAVVSLVLQDYLEGVAIFIMLNIMAGFGLWQEGQADAAAKALSKQDKTKKTVIRDSQRVDIFPEDIVPGDIIYLPNGSMIPADGRVIVAVNAEKDTSPLDGESFPKIITLDTLPENTIINEQHNMLHLGTTLVAGNATIVVTSTGSDTEIGKLADKLHATEKEDTPLDQQLDSLGDAMTKIFIWMAVVVIGLGMVREVWGLISAGHSVFGFSSTAEGFSLYLSFAFIELLKDSFINAIALIIAAIPEGLPAVLSITLAIAAQVMVKRNALVKRPKAAEGSGSMTVLLTDKTGTLTASAMTVTHVYFNNKLHEVSQLNGELKQDPALARLARVAKLCNNSSDPTESALLKWVQHLGFEAFGDVETRLLEHAFNQALKRMTTLHPSQDEQIHIFTKGAAEVVLDLCDEIHLQGQNVELTTEHRTEIKAAIKDLAAQGLRVVALADRLIHKDHPHERNMVEDDLVFAGLLGIMDPPRPDVAPAVDKLKVAGIRTVMVTGDNPLTAYTVGKMVHIVEEGMPYEQVVITGEEIDAGVHRGEKLDDIQLKPDFEERVKVVRVFARVSPSHKAELVTIMQKAGFIVGMCGDGVNDALALKKSDVGLAMGNGVEVAREAAAVVLTDSRFSTIPVAVEEGRNVLYRIKLYLSYILSGNGCEVGVFVLAYLLGLPIPLTALVLLVINFATDSFPALAMAFEAGEKDVMQQPPRQREAPFINNVMWVHIGVQTVVATAIIMGVYYYFLEVAGASLEFARAAAFMTYIAQKLYRAFTARSLTHNIWEIGVFANKWSIGAVAISLTIALIFVYVPFVNEAVGMTALNLNAIGLAALVGIFPPIAEEITKVFVRRQSTGS